ncbi:MAG: PilX N-terminal domain-containing pilus assembly protein [Methylococcaceae bacterium]|nr:PilX N-terminal domain-containing pilus assembly protein [Methylococcaceae bacterium]MDP3904384.1 PilX N-terminal domain-containing pilus assembly protein [Methylococcaceae bacterium]
MNKLQITDGKLSRLALKVGALSGAFLPPGNSIERETEKPTHPTRLSNRPPTHQTGAVLIVSLIMLLLLTLIGVTSMQTTSLEEKMAGNMRDKDLAFQAAESALTVAEATLNPVPPAVLPTFFVAGTGGFYTSDTTIDLSESEIVTDSFWTSNPVATSTVTGLGNGIATPKYIIQIMQPGLGLATCLDGSSGCTNYRIRVRATGGSTNAVVILESIYKR